MTAISRSGRGNSKANNATTGSSRAYPGDVAWSYAPTYPTLVTARQVAALAARLPECDPAMESRIRHIEALAVALNWSDDSRAAQIWRLVDWQAVWRSLGKAHGMTASRIERLAPEELAELLAIQVDAIAASGRKFGAAKTA
jgi:hypothetical protein